jgi:RNA-directed DNA polymerase
MPVEGRTLTSGALSKMVRTRRLAMSLETPEKIRTLQRKLYRKATAEPEYRFYLLCDKICREDILRHAYALARDNAGAPGVDGESFSDVDSTGIEKWLAGLREEMPSKMYRPAPVRRVMIPKPGGGERPLGIPTIRDRVVQTPAKLVLEPIFEADLESSAYGYRPGRDATDAVKEVHRLICRGYTDVVDADLSKYFDSIPHSALLASVARRIVDRHVLCLIKMWLKVPVEERSGDGKRRMSGGKSNTRGTPQGGVVRPMVVVLKLTRFRGHPNTYVQGAHDGEDKTTLHTGIPWPDGRAGYAPAARPRNRRCFGGRRKQLF